MQLDEPNDLLRLCYEYKIKRIPVSDEGSITGSIEKDDLVSQLSHSEGFESDLRKLIRSLTKPVEEGFIEGLKEKLSRNDITGIPVVTKSGSIDRTITPGVLNTEEKSEQFLDQSNQLQVYEDLLDEFPFPVRIERDGANVFENRRMNSYDVSQAEWHEEVISLSNFSVYLYIPVMVKEVLDAYYNLETGEQIELRTLLDTVEYEFLKKSHDSTESISSAAELVSLPRQTFNYRWNKKNEDPDND